VHLLGEFREKELAFKSRDPKMAMIRLKHLFERPIVAKTIGLIIAARQPAREPAPSEWVEPAPLPAEAQWGRVEGVLSAGLRSAAAARRLHTTAAQQLDAASYALQRMLEELSPVLEIARGPGAAVVHRLEPAIRAARRDEVLAA